MMFKFNCNKIFKNCSIFLEFERMLNFKIYFKIQILTFVHEEFKLSSNAAIIFKRRKREKDDNFAVFLLPRCSEVFKKI